MEERNPLEVLGINETLKIDGSSIIHTTKDSSVRVIPITNTQNLSIHPPSLLWGPHGRMSFNTATWGGGGGVILFRSKDELPYAQNIQKYILDFQANASIPATPQVSVADELVKLKDLVDQGILTQEEFEHKKKVLLGM